MEEIFKPIEKVDGMYLISNFGRVKRLAREQLMKGKPSGYVYPEEFIAEDSDKVSITYKRKPFSFKKK